MSEWGVRTLGSLVKTNVSSVGKDYPFKEIAYLDTGSITKGKVDDFQFLNLADAPSRAKRLVQENDIIYSAVRPIQRHYGFITVPLNNLVVSTGFVVIRCDQNELDSKYLYYYLTSDSIVEELDIIAEASTSTYPSLKPSDIEKLEINLPHDIDEQKAIAAVLSSLDDKIDLLHRQNQTLEAMAATLFRQWFVEEAQEDWADVTLGDIADNVRSSVKTTDINPGIKYVGLEHIDRRNIALSQYGFGEEVGSNKSAFEVHDILFGKLRPYFHKVCFAPFAGICSTDILVVRPKRPEHFAFCLFAFFQNDVVEYANLGSGGTRMPRTDWTTLKSYPIAIPDAKSIERFNSVAKPAIERITHNLGQIRTLEKLRDNLLPKLMSGEVRVAL